MSFNLWNLKSSNDRIKIKQRTQAHKKHLISLVNMKSAIDDKFVKNDKIWIKHMKNTAILDNSKNSNKSRDQSRIISNLSNSKNSNLNSNLTVKHNRIRSLKGSSIVQERRIQKQNQGLVSRIANIDKIKRSQTQGVRKFINLSNTLSNISFTQRVMKQKKIQFQNCKMFDRLVNTTSTIDRTLWNKSIRDSNINPDYTVQVTRQSQKKRVTMKHLQLKSSQCYSNSYKQLPGIIKKIQYQCR